jgi:uncharacterized metal-binding protein
MMPDRVCLQPCLGSATAAATVGRQATYAALADLGRLADLGCAPALFAEVPEDVIFIQQDYVIAIESCDKLCANHLITQKGYPVHATVRVDEILQQAGIDCATLPVETIPLEHPAVVAVAAEIVRVARELLEGAA